MGDNIQHQWILEFLLRQPTEDHALHRLVIALSLLVPDHRLVKTLLLRRISSEINNGIISEKILESLELIEEIDHLNNIRSLDSMKDAYCAVALDCVVRFLKENPKNFSEYTKAVDRIWRGRVLAMEKAQDVCLISEWTKDLRTQLEEAVHDVSVCNYILSEDTKTDALKAVGMFLSKVYEELGPPFLEVAAKIMSSEGEDGQSLSNISIGSHVQVSQEGSFHDQSNELDENNRDVFGDNVSRVDGNSLLGSPCVTNNKCNPVLTPECGELGRNPNELPPEITHSPPEPTPETGNADVGAVQDHNDFSLGGQVEARQGNCADALCENSLSGDVLDVDCGVEPTPETANVDVSAVQDHSDFSLGGQVGARQGTCGDALCEDNLSGDVDCGVESTPETVNEVVDEVLVASNLAALRLSQDAASKVDVGCSVKCNSVLTPEFARIKEALQSSIMDLNNVVIDPLPDALCMAATISANMAREGVVNNVQSADIQTEVDIDRHVQSAQIQNEDTGKCDHFVGDNSGNVQSEEGNVRKSTPVSQPSLRSLNSTAEALECEGEFEPGSDENQVRPHLPTPENRVVSPLRREETKNVAGRRKKRRWSTLEEDTLRDAVKEFGRGNWKLILDTYHHIFADRTTVDLKDKWRNMTR